MERFLEPALLLVLRDRATHGYELQEELPGLLGVERVDMGGLYRTLRALEEHAFVRSWWDAEAPGPAKRVYELTDAGAGLLDEWASSLERARDRIDAFLNLYRQEGGDHVPRP